MKQKFYFNTGVKQSYSDKPWAKESTAKPEKGTVFSPNGVMLIPFECDDVPENATFKFACDYPELATEKLICREIHNSTLISKYAFFVIP